MIVSGNTDISKVYYSGYTISKIYACGGELVWSGDTPTPPTPTGNKIDYVVNGNTYSIECSGTTLESDEIRFDLIRHGYRPSGVTSAEIGLCVNTIDMDAFNMYTALSSITIPNSVTTIGDNAFYECYSLSSLTLPNSVTSIGVSCFDGCANLTSIVIPSGLTSISVSSFNDCYRLTNIVIPSTVTSIGDQAFEIEDVDNPNDEAAARNTLSSRTVYIYATTPLAIGSQIFDSSLVGVAATYPIYVPSESVSAYQTAWPQYASRIQAIP